MYSDPDGTAFVATNEAGDLEWQIEHYPFGDEYENTQTERNSDIGFTGKPFDEEIGLLVTARTDPTQYWARMFFIEWHCIFQIQ